MLYEVITNNVATSTSGVGAGMTVDIIATANVVTGITITQNGVNYAVGDVITITPNNGAGSTLCTFVIDSYSNTLKRIYSYNEGLYFENNIPYRAGFDRKQNKYTAAIKNNSPTPLEGQVITGPNSSGIKAYFV